MKRHLLTACAAWAATAAAMASEQPLQTQRCNDPPPAFDTLPAGGIHVAKPSGKWLKPGTTRQTNGTNSVDSPELDGWVLLNEPRAFSFVAGGNAVAGIYTEAIVRGTDKRCKSHVKVDVQTGCVTRLVLHGYKHPKKLVANYRRDLGSMSDTPSESATRSAADIDGNTSITFTLADKVCAGQTSRWLLLNTDVAKVQKQQALQFVVPGGLGSTERFDFFVP